MGLTRWRSPRTTCPAPPSRRRPPTQSWPRLDRIAQPWLHDLDARWPRLWLVAGGSGRRHAVRCRRGGAGRRSRVRLPGCPQAAREQASVFVSVMGCGVGSEALGIKPPSDSERLRQRLFHERGHRTAHGVPHSGQRLFPAKPRTIKAPAKVSGRNGRVPTPGARQCTQGCPPCNFSDFRSEAIAENWPAASRGYSNCNSVRALERSLRTHAGRGSVRVRPVSARQPSMSSGWRWMWARLRRRVRVRWQGR
jgi:hypothetical protein